MLQRRRGDVSPGGDAAVTAATGSSGRSGRKFTVRGGTSAL